MARCPRLALNPFTMVYEPKRPRPGRPRKRKVSVGDRKLRPAQILAKERRLKLAAMLAVGVSEAEALTLSGFSPRSRHICGEAAVVQSVVEIREQLRGEDGFTLRDSAEFYRGISMDESEDSPDRLRARGRLDALLGYDASKEIKVSQETTEIKMALGVLADLRIGSPAQLAEILEAEVQEVSVVG